MICTERRLRICKALLLANLVFIWGNSLLPGEISQGISDAVKDLIGWLATDGISGSSGGSGSGLIRKFAHFLEFASLGFGLMWLGGMRRKGKLQPFFWGVAAACVDETIQFFVPGRAPGLKDVAIDSCGVLTGMILLLLGHIYFKKRSTKPILEDK